jgi:PST family polysaccharide transporter
VSLRKIIVNTATISSINILRLLSQFLAIPILARLLSPADYGLVGMAMPFVLFAMMLADSGIGESLVRTPMAEREIWSTCFWLALLLGAVLAGLMALSAPLASRIFGDPRLGPIVLTLSIVVWAQALCTIPGAALQQAQKFNLIAIQEIIAVVVGISAAIIVAISGGGAWALVWQQLAFFGTRVALTFKFSGFVPLMSFRTRDVKEHLLFGRDVLSVNVVGFFARSLDNLIIGKILTAASVGIYTMAFQFARLPSMIVTGPLQYVLYGQLALSSSNKDIVRSTFIIITQVLAIVIFPGMGMVAAAYHPVFNLLLSEKWAAAGKLFVLVAPACTLSSVTSLCGTMMLVMGRADVRLKLTLEFGVLWVIILLSSVSFGLEVAAVAYNLAVFCYTPRTLLMVLPLIDCPAATYWRALVVPTAITGICVTTYCILNEKFQIHEPMQVLMAASVMAFGILAGGLIQRRVVLKELALWRIANSHG